MNTMDKRIEEFVEANPDLAKLIAIKSIAEKQPCKTLENLHRINKKIMQLGDIIIELWDKVPSDNKELIGIYFEDMNDDFINIIKRSNFILNTGVVLSFLYEENGEIKYDCCPEDLKVTIKEIVDGAPNKLAMYAIVANMLGYRNEHNNIAYPIIQLLKE